MSLDDSVHWIAGLREGSASAAEQLWQRYFQQLTRLASNRLPRHLRRDFDEEDVVVSAFHSLCAGVAADRFPNLDDRDNLWSLLVVITARKVSHCVRDGQAQKRVAERCGASRCSVTIGSRGGWPTLSDRNPPRSLRSR